MFCSKRLMEKRQTFLTKYFGLTNVLKKKPHHIFELHIFFGRTDISPGTGVPPICMNYSHTHGSSYFQTCPYCRLGICRENLLILPRVDKVFRKPWRWRGLCKNSHCQIHSNTPDALGIEVKKASNIEKFLKWTIKYHTVVRSNKREVLNKGLFLHVTSVIQTIKSYTDPVSRLLVLTITSYAMQYVWSTILQ